MTMRLKNRLTRDDSGSTLILVLVLILFISVMSAAILTLGNTTLKSSLTTQEVAEEQYDEEAAMSTAVNTVRNSSFDNDVNIGEICPPSDATGPNLGDTFATPCVPISGTGEESGGTLASAANTPPNALLGLGDNTNETGVGVEFMGVGELAVNGQVYSRSELNVGTGPLNLVNGSAFARINCSSTTITPTPTCPGTPSGYVEPDYAQPAFGSAAAAPLPSCSDASPLSFSEGYYNSATALNALFVGCPEKIFHFTPGTYFFDFKGAESPYFIETNVWTLNDPAIRMIAGTSQPSDEFKDRCVAPSQSAGSGVDFVFGGRSRLEINAGSVAICGTYRANQPATAVFGADDPLSLPGPEMLTTNTAVDACDSVAPFEPSGILTLPQSVRYSDTSYAEADFPSGNAQPTECVDITVEKPTGPPPVGSILKNAMLVVRYSASNFGRLAMSVAVSPKGADDQEWDSSPVFESALPEVDATPIGNPRTVYYDLTSVMHTQFRTKGMSDAVIRVQAEKTSNGAGPQARIYTAQLQLEWLPPSIRPQNADDIQTFAANPGAATYPVTVNVMTAADSPDPSVQAVLGNRTSTDDNCVADAPYPAGGCAFFSTPSNNSNAELYVRGTLFAPLAAVDFRQTGIDYPIVDIGTVARKIYVNGAATSSAGIKIFATRKFGPPNIPLRVYQWTFACDPDEQDCTPPTLPENPNSYFDDPGNWELVGTAEVQYTNGDDFPDPPAGTGNRDVAVQSWQFISPYERP